MSEFDPRGQNLFFENLHIKNLHTKFSGDLLSGFRNMSHVLPVVNWFVSLTGNVKHRGAPLLKKIFT